MLFITFVAVGVSSFDYSIAQAPHVYIVQVLQSDEGHRSTIKIGRHREEKLGPLIIDVLQQVCERNIS